MYSVSPKPHGLNFEFLSLILFAKFRNILWSGFGAILIFRKLKVALNLRHRIFETLPKV